MTTKRYPMPPRAMPLVDESRTVRKVWGDYLAGIDDISRRVSEPVTFTNTDGAIGGLTISATPTQAEVVALRDACETLADDVRSLKAALENSNQMKAS